ncbi:DUF5986 family protein [Paraclostridium sordellii]|uniref:Uncharacterized protein n=1 Tax=Paraclostridium sordellii TaxID=1505 RepID=A0A9P1P8Q3_PARSO|nr:DUF5986 family protein [Paeniclostridium sordellii]CEO32720.1 Uncharacterised protein [[Clostridium] sordellii] [Paeniclostridium sordellii]
MDRREVDISLITKIVKKAYHKDMIDFHNHYRLTTRNGDPGIRWDFINTNIEDNFKEDMYKTLLIKRGYWNQIVVYNTYDKRLYFVRRESRYQEVKKDKKRKNLHLIQMLGSVNEKDKSEAKVIFKQKLPEYISKAKEYILITYEYNENNNKCDFKVRKITSKFKCNYEEKWDSDLIV